jgi:hypothetical protein
MSGLIRPWYRVTLFYESNQAVLIGKSPGFLKEEVFQTRVNFIDKTGMLMRQTHTQGGLAPRSYHPRKGMRQLASLAGIMQGSARS